MNQAAQEPANGLTPEAAELLETYFARIHGALLVTAAGECEEAVEDLREHVMEELAGSAGTPGDVTRVLAALGPPEALAAQYAAGVEEGSGPAAPSGPDHPRLHGRVLGMPYDVRLPESGRAARRWWNPLDTRVFVPRVFGAGWDINFGALAVKSHLVRPDDEDEPFGMVPNSAIVGALLLPISLCVVSLLLMVLAWPMLPQSVPAHWNAFGQPDQFWDRGLLVAFIALMAVAPSALAVVVHLRRRAALNQVAVTAFALLATTLAMSQVVQTMFYVNGDQGAAPTFVGLLLALVFPFALFVAMSHIGRDAERQRDLEKGPKKERG